MFKLGGLTLLIWCLICAAIGALLWPYTINTWLIFFGKAPVITWWHGAIMGFLPILGPVTVGSALVTWLLMLFLV